MATIKTKYNIGDTVWGLYNYQVFSKRIVRIDASLGSKYIKRPGAQRNLITTNELETTPVEELYYIEGIPSATFSARNLFKTKKELKDWLGAL